MNKEMERRREEAMDGESREKRKHTHRQMDRGILCIQATSTYPLSISLCPLSPIDTATERGFSCSNNTCMCKCWTLNLHNVTVCVFMFMPVEVQGVLLTYAQLQANGNY